MRYINLRLLTYLLTIKLTKISGYEFGTLLWRHLMLQRKTAIKVHNYTPPVHNCQKYLGKFTSYMTFGAHKLVPSEPFLDS